MKKFSVILLIAVLAMTSVFADGITTDLAISGKAAAKYVVNFNDGTFKYTAPGLGDLKLTLKLDGAAAAKDAEGEKLWAEMTAAATVTQTVADGDKISPAIALELSTFKLHYADVWAVDFLEAADLTNLAKSGLTKVYAPTAKAMSAYDDAYSFADKNGVTFDWTKTGFVFAAAADGDLKPTGDTNVMFDVQTPTYTVAKGFTLNGAGGISYDYAPAATTAAVPATFGWGYKKTGATTYTAVTAADVIVEGSKIRVPGATTATYTDYDIVWATLTDLKPATKTAESMAWNIAASLALDYKSEDGKIAVSAATDQAIGFGFANGAKTKLTYDVDADVKMTFSAATAEVYYAKNAVAMDKTAKYDTIKNLLSAQAIMNLNMFNPAIKATFTGLNLLHKSAVLSTELEVKLGTNFTINAYALDVLGTAKREAKFTAEDGLFYSSNFEGQKLGIKSTMVFGSVTVTPEVYYRNYFKQLGYAAKATYKNTYFTVDGGVDGYFICKKAAKQSLFKVSAGISAADTIVKNATVSAKYASGNLLKNGATDPYEVKRADKTSPTANTHTAGSLTLSCEVSF